jgi:hypothetical protein
MNKCNLKKIIAFFYFLIFAWSDIQGAEKEKLEEGTDPQIDRVIHVSLNQVEDLVPLLKSHDLSLKKLASDFLRRISENENLEKHPALKALLVYGNDSDKIFSREKLFRFLIKNKAVVQQQSVAETLFQSSEKDDKIIGAEILCSIYPPLDLFDLRFQAIDYLARNTCLTDNQFNFLSYFALEPNVNPEKCSNAGYSNIEYDNKNRYNALILVYENHAEKYKEKITMEKLLGSFENLCQNSEEPGNHLWNSYKILFKHRDKIQEPIKKPEVLKKLLKYLNKLKEEDKNLSYDFYMFMSWDPNLIERHYIEIENLYEESLHLKDLREKAIRSIKKDKEMNFYYVLIRNQFIPPFSENDLSEDVVRYYGKILWVSNRLSGGITSFTERLLIETLKYCKNQDFISRVVWNVYDTKHFAQFRSNFYKTACRELNVDRISDTKRQFSYFRDSYEDYRYRQTIKEEVFKIKFSTQPVEVRTSNDLYVSSTWESAIPNQGLAEHSAKTGCKISVDGMCCSHAVVCALEYCHNRSDLLASYLHKAVTGGYEKGMSLRDAMEFVKKSGVMALPKEQTVKHGSGLSWPDGERYKFSEIIDADTLFVSNSNDKSSRYIKILKKYNHPIVVSILCGYKGYRDQSPFLKYRGTDGDKKKEIQNDAPPPNAQESYHAIILYGFRKSTECFFVKNSWGPYGENGLCTLPYDYINKFSHSAFVGLGHEDCDGDGIHEGQAKNNCLVEQIMHNVIPIKERERERERRKKYLYRSIECLEREKENLYRHMRELEREQEHNNMENTMLQEAELDHNRICENIRHLEEYEETIL